MIKKIAFSFLLIGISFSIKAQDRYDNVGGRTTFSIKAGMLQSDIYGKDVNYLALDGKTSKKTNFSIGVAVDNSLSKHFALKHELFYQQYGSSFWREEDERFKAKLEMHSLRLHPISAVFKVGGLELYAGPYVNMLLYSSVTAVDEEGNKYKDHNIFGSTADDQEDGQYLQKMDYGIVVGAEYVFKFGMSIGIQYSRGFATLFDNSNAYGLEDNTSYNDLRIYNEQVGINIGYRF